MTLRRPDRAFIGAAVRSCTTTGDGGPLRTSLHPGVPGQPPNRPHRAGSKGGCARTTHRRRRATQPARRPIGDRSGGAGALAGRSRPRGGSTSSSSGVETSTSSTSPRPPRTGGSGRRRRGALARARGRSSGRRRRRPRDGGAGGRDRTRIDLVLCYVALERQPPARLDRHDLAAVAVGQRPDQLVAPGLLDPPLRPSAVTSVMRRGPAARRPPTIASRSLGRRRLRVDADERLGPARPDEQPRAVGDEELRTRRPCRAPGSATTGWPASVGRRRLRAGRRAGAP